MEVLFAHRASPTEQATAGFGVTFDWDIDLTSGYSNSFLVNMARKPGIDRFSGCDTPEVGARLNDGRFDAVLVHGWHLKSYLQGIIAARSFGLPVLVRGDSQLATPRSALKRGAKALAFPVLLRAFDAVLYVGKRSLSYYLQYGYPARRLFFSPHCVDNAWFAERATIGEREALRARYGVNVDTTLLLFAGKLVPFKRPLDIISAAALCQAAGRRVEILVAGDGALRASLMSAAQSFGVRLHMLGFRNQTEMPAAYAASDCLVLPSDERETWGLVANEALACGRPIIVSDACGCSEDLAGDNLVGRNYKMGDVRALSAAIGSLLERKASPFDIAARSATYSLARAADGICESLRELGVSTP